MGRRLEAEVPERLQQHREQVHQVEEAERRQQLVEEAVQLLPGQQEDGGRVAWGIFIFIIIFNIEPTQWICVDTVSGSPCPQFQFQWLIPRPALISLA